MDLSLRRLRNSPWIRELSREVHVDSKKMIQPLFYVEGLKERESIPGLTGVHRENENSLLRQIESDLEIGVKKFLLFGVPANKKNSAPFNFEPTAKIIQKIKSRFGKDLFLATDVCLCSYTESGHCGVLHAEGHHLENSTTVEQLALAALSYAQAGADCVAPSDMMDGRIRAIRETLDYSHLHETLIMSYSAKFHSRFYGPFRLAADSAPKNNVSTLKDRATYQIDPARPSDALLSSLRDQEEGADILMVKPGLPYLDVLLELSQKIQLPWAVYEVSGEFAAIEVLAQQGLMDGPKAHLEAWTSLTRAGAQMIITYGARNAKKWLETQ